jgi:hypothetical protein
MTEPPDDLTPGELLERIIGLERENLFLKQHFRKIQIEVHSLRAELTDLGKAFKAEVDDVTSEFKHDRAEFKHVYKYLTDVHQHLTGIYDQLWPLVHKVFPCSIKTQKQIAMIVRNGGRSWDDKKPS